MLQRKHCNQRHLYVSSVAKSMLPGAVGRLHAPRRVFVENSTVSRTFREEFGTILKWRAKSVNDEELNANHTIRATRNALSVEFKKRFRSRHSRGSLLLRLKCVLHFTAVSFLARVVGGGRYVPTALLCRQWHVFDKEASRVRGCMLWAKGF